MVQIPATVRELTDAQALELQVIENVQRVDVHPLDEAQEKLRACCEDEAVADLLGLAVGVLEAVEGERSQQEIAWVSAAAWEVSRSRAGRPLRQSDTTPSCREDR